MTFDYTEFVKKLTIKNVLNCIDKLNFILYNSICKQLISKSIAPLYQKLVYSL